MQSYSKRKWATGAGRDKHTKGTKQRHKKQIHEYNQTDLQQSNADQEEGRTRSIHDVNTTDYANKRNLVSSHHIKKINQSQKNMEDKTKNFLKDMTISSFT